VFVIDQSDRLTDCLFFTDPGSGGFGVVAEIVFSVLLFAAAAVGVIYYLCEISKKGITYRYYSERKTLLVLCINRVYCLLLFIF